MCYGTITPHLVLIVKYGVHTPGGFSDQEPDDEVRLDPGLDEQSA